MNKRMFKKIQSRNNKAMLIAKLIKYSNGCLNKKQLEEIVNTHIYWEFSNGSETYNYKLADQNCFIKYTRDENEFKEFLFEGTTGLEHSWAGKEISRIKVKTLIGEVQIGFHQEVDYSDNGNIIPDSPIHKEPNFCVDDLIVVYQFKNEYSNYNNNYYNIDSDTIIIYDGRKRKEKVSPEIQYILDNFNI